MPELGPEAAAAKVPAPRGVEPASRSAARISDSDSFDVRITRVNPPVIPERGRIVLSGTVTNTTDEALGKLNVHPLTSYAPMTTATELAAAASADPEITFGGQRLLSPAVLDNSIEELAPGETASWRVRIPVEELEITGGEGVYVFGVHVLSNDADGGRDDIADGRSRTFVPKVAPSRAATPTSVVVPVRNQVKRAADGQVEEVAQWQEALGAGGRLDNLLTLMRQAEVPVTALVDPAVLVAAQQLAEGNPARDISPTVTEEPQGEQPDGPEQDLEPSSGATTGQGSVSEGGTVAGTWLADLLDVLRVREVLALPYGDLDVAAASARRPDLLETASTRAREAMDAFGVSTSTAVVPTDGVLPSRALRDVGDATVLLSTTVLPDSDERTLTPPPATRVDGSTVLLHDGDPVGADPVDPANPMAMRQRILAEAAVRTLAGTGDPLVVNLPATLDPGAAARTMFKDVDVPFIDWVPLASLRPGQAPRSDLAYPAESAEQEISEAMFRAADDAVGNAAVLDSLLPLNDTVADQVVADVLPELSVHARDEQVSGLARIRGAAAWSTTRLAQVGLSAPSFVILSSESGPFSLTVRNGLEQPIAFKVRADSNGEVAISAPETVELDAKSSRTLTLTARAENLGVHRVNLVATTLDGTPVGAGEEINIRSNAVSKVIWVVLAVGVGILFVAISIRLVRRVRNTRGDTA